ncbi:hypothetical protein OIU79_023820 [Salix purpurea]|uniref:BTB domain-containing protein n=1 Tax=Salix purpurea TaxID=77065 RepID=A0A9Q1A9C2_SALPP|nr:hypothetical protein OIU79_023820 [Salix purpurea]
MQIMKDHTFSSLVRLNIGGKKFCTTIDTLTQGEPDSMLAAMFRGRLTVSEDPAKGYVFIDRDGKHFRHILNWLRDGVVPTLTDAGYSELTREAEYYQLLFLRGYGFPAYQSAGNLLSLCRLFQREHAFFRDFARLPKIIKCIQYNKVKFRGINFSGLDLSKLDLSYVDFSYASLQNVFFSRANLHCAKFRDVDAEGSIFHNANLRECEFTGANLRGALLAGANLQSANLQDACLVDCSFYGANLRSAHLQTADLTNANFEGANLEGANLKGAKLNNANLKGANLQRAYLRHVNLHKYSKVTCQTESSLLSIWKMQSLTVPICLEQFDRICARLCPEYIYIFSFFDKLTLKDNIKHGLDLTVCL